jgi:predicted Zn-dependent peptidase
MNETQYKKVYSLIEDIIYKLNEKGITASELNDAKKQTIVEMTLSQDSTASRMSANAKRVIYNVNNESFDERIKRINDVTKSDVNKLIRKYLKMEEMSKGIIGPMNLNI